MAQDKADPFDIKLAEYKEMVILRQEECVKIAEIVDEKARALSSKAKKFKIIVIVLGAIIAVKGVFDLIMVESQAPLWAQNLLLVVFTLIGVVISVVASLEAAFRYEGKSGEMRELSSLCRDYDRRFMSDYKKYIDPKDPKETLARLEALIDLQNKNLNSIRQRTDSLDIDLHGVEICYKID